MAYSFRSVFQTASVAVAVISVIANAAVIPDNFRSSPNNSEFSRDEDSLPLLRAIHSGSFMGKSINAELEAELLKQAIFPSYIQSFLENFKSRHNDDYLKVLLDGVDDMNCKAHVSEWVVRATNWKLVDLTSDAEKWVSHMFDSWGKPPEGVLEGHVNAYGDFDECIDIDVDDLKILNPAYQPESKSFEGRYCTVYIADYATAGKPTMPRTSLLRNDTRALDDIEIRKAVSVKELLSLVLNREGVLISPSLGVCFPNSCTQPDVNRIMINALYLMYTRNEPEIEDPTGYLWPYTIACYESKKPDYDAADISVMALIGTITAICLGSGIIDYWLNHGVDKPPNRGLAFKYLMAFSLYTNIKKWLSTRKSAEDLGCLHGIRFLSTSWVVLAHTYYAITFLPSWNMVDVKRVYEDMGVLTVINSTFAVDTFFVMSGMLVGYNILKVLDKTKGKLNIIMLYIHRYLRLTPTYAILIGIMATIVPYLGNGPYWAVMSRWGTICEDNWWTNLLYVNNFVNTSWLCQGEAWYLANDMQFYVLSPFILYPMWRWEMAGLVLLSIYSVLSCVCPALLVHFYDTTPTTLPTRDIGKWFTHIYIKPYARIQTFLVGIWLAWILHKTRGKKVVLPKLVVVLFWALSTATAPLLLYSIQPWFDPDKEIPKVAGLLYAGLSRVAWGLVVSWVIFACIKGYGGLVNSFLSWSVFMPLGRLCYCVYLVSLHLQMILHIRFTQPLRYDTYTQINFFMAHMLMSYMVGFVCTLLFESPFMILQKLIFEGGGGNRPARPALDANAKRPSQRHGIFYNDIDTILNRSSVNGGVTEPTGKERQE